MSVRDQSGAMVGSERLWQSRLFQDGVRRMPRFDPVVDDDRTSRVRRQPNLMVAFAIPVEPAACLAQGLAYQIGIVGHQAATRSIESRRIKVTLISGRNPDARSGL